MFVCGFRLHGFGLAVRKPTPTEGNEENEADNSPGKAFQQVADRVTKW
jgi:hypothetical protein